MSTDARCPVCNGFRQLPRILHDGDVPRECSDPFHKMEAPIEVAPDPIVELPQAPAPQPEAAAKAATIPKPVCPYCGVEGRIFGQIVGLGSLQVCVVRCANNECRKILFGFQPLEFQMAPPPGGVPGGVH
jgi:hypothetical protein